MLDNFQEFLSLLTFYKINLSKKILKGVTSDGQLIWIQFKRL